MEFKLLGQCIECATILGQLWLFSPKAEISGSSAVTAKRKITDGKRLSCCCIKAFSQMMGWT